MRNPSNFDNDNGDNTVYIMPFGIDHIMYTFDEAEADYWRSEGYSVGEITMSKLYESSDKSYLNYDDE